MPSLVEIGSVVLEKKSLQQQDDNDNDDNDDRQILIRKTHLSLGSGELKMLVSINVSFFKFGSQTVIFFSE